MGTNDPGAGLFEYVNSLLNRQMEYEAFKLKCSFLPREVADQLRVLREQRQKEDWDHQRRLEIAKIGRARNFWGD